MTNEVSHMSSYCIISLFCVLATTHVINYKSTHCLKLQHFSFEFVFEQGRKLT